VAARPERIWRHKWRDRGRAARGRAGQQSRPPYFTAAGRVSETSRGNLFWRDKDGVWCTPPLDEQVLPGVTRREVIDLLDRTGTPVQIRPGAVADLHQAGGVFWTSSLSGASRSPRSMTIRCSKPRSFWPI
jgi:para-aminobenzoate synthetase/4-amino-4-deoxychorismate lyase